MNISSTPPVGVQSYNRARHTRRRIDFASIKAAALADAHSVCQHLLPGGKQVGREYVALNPKRADARPGSFKVNLRSGRWADFAIGVGGGDLVSLVAYVLDLRQSEAARRVAEMLHLNPEVL